MMVRDDVTDFVLHDHRFAPFLCQSQATVRLRAPKTPSSIMSRGIAGHQVAYATLQRVPLEGRFIHRVKWGHGYSVLRLRSSKRQSCSAMMAANSVRLDEAKRHGKDASNIAPGFRISGLGHLIEAGIEADRLVVFGD